MMREVGAIPNKGWDRTVNPLGFPPIVDLEQQQSQNHQWKLRHRHQSSFGLQNSDTSRTLTIIPDQPPQIQLEELIDNRFSLVG